MKKSLQQGWQEIAQSRFDSALAIASEWLDDPVIDIQQQAHRLMGMAYYRKQAYAEAIPYFERSIQMIDNLKDRFSLAMCYGVLGEIDQSEQIFQSIDSPWGLPVECYGSFAMLRADQGNFAGAVVLLEKIKLSYTLFGISDETYISGQGKLPFSHALDFIYYILAKVSQKFDSYQWLNSFAEEMDEEGKIALGKVSAQIAHSKGPFLIQQPRSRLQYPLVCRIEGEIHNEKGIHLIGRMLYGKLHVGDQVSLYFVNSSAVIGKAKVSSLKTAQNFRNQVQPKEVIDIALDGLEKELMPEGSYFLVDSTCQSPEYFQQIPLI